MWLKELKERKQKKEERFKVLENRLAGLEEVLIPTVIEQADKLEERVTTLANSVETVEVRLGAINYNCKTAETVAENVQNETDTKQKTIDSRVKNLEDGWGFLKWVVVILIIVVIVMGVQLYNEKIIIDGQQEEINAQQEEVNMLHEEIDAISVNVSAQTDSDAAATFIDAVLPRKDGEWYNKDDEWYDKNGNKFYYDPDCKYAISNPRFCTYDSVFGEDSKGNTIKVYRLANGDFAYIQSNFSVDLKRVN